MKTTITDIAKLANVSETTVSLAFKSNSRISDNTRERVLRIAGNLNYRPNTTARELRSGRTRTIGFLINDIINPFYGTMIRMSEEIAVERGYEIVFSESQWNSKNEERIVDKMLGSRIEGIIVSLSERTTNAYKQLIESGIPHVVVDAKPPFYHSSFVINDAEYTGILAARHLSSIGCTTIAILNGKRLLGNFSSIVGMENGFKHFLDKQTERRISCDVYNSGLSIESGKKSFMALKKSGIPYDGIFCMSDLCALGVIDEALRDGLIPGKDFAIIGVDDNEVSSLSIINLTSIRIAYDEIARTATEYLISAIENEHQPKMEKMIAPELILRDSTALF